MQLDLFKDVKEKIDWKDPEQVRAYNREYYQNNKEQVRAYKRAYRRVWYQKNKEKINEYKRKYYQKNKEKFSEHTKKNKEKLSEYYKEYYKNSKEKRTEYTKNNKDKLKERRKKWKENNPALVLQHVANRRARKKRAIPDWLKDCSIEKRRVYTVYLLSRLLAKADGIERHVDHMWPLSDGGPHWSGNLQVLTEKENLEKSAYSCPKLKKQIRLNLKEVRILHGTTA